jgi:hypothetical protein
MLLGCTLAALSLGDSALGYFGALYDVVALNAGAIAILWSILYHPKMYSRRFGSLGRMRFQNTPRTKSANIQLGQAVIFGFVPWAFVGGGIYLLLVRYHTEAWPSLLSFGPCVLFFLAGLVVLIAASFSRERREP